MPLAPRDASVIRIPYEDATLRVAVVDNLTVAVWFEAPTGAQMRKLDEVDLAMRAQTEGGVGFLNVIVSGFPRFSQEVREEAARQVAYDDGRSVVGAHLVLLRGLTGAAARTFLSTVMLLARPDYPSRVFGDAREGARWLAKHLDAGASFDWSEDRVADVIAALIHPPSPAA